MTSTDHSLKFAYVGLGEMGSAMAQNLQNWLAKNGHPSPLMVWNRSAAKAQQLSGVKVAETLEEVAQYANIVFSCLLNDQAVRDCYDQLFKHLPQGKKTIFCEMSTIAPKLTCDLHTQATELGAGLIATPIFGLPPKARAAELIIIKAGDLKLREIVSPYLIPAMGNKTIECGEDVGEALKMKLSGNSMVLGFAQVMADGLTLAAASGVGQDKVVSFIEGMYPNTPLVAYVKKMAASEYANISFRVAGVKKDLKHIIELGAEYNIDLSAQRAMYSNFEEVEKLKGDNLDITSVVGAVRSKAGLDFDLDKKE
ncbi:hypothetical protein K450DRAFT_245345 [Umbelopsis ramanniana AG]|uniref:6-phosphogluconate dehydrogenase NADP-binding domain-containing protein n=1 Tax=Umbelopsis ramanniana AG TaxID=1314678 RepID=A0AAD5E7A8_UMBRA|nr:uncharacterized protein K450DRAFT_245345 [Umbelopsis ramanniana AG]KAI8578758.1 hypothetical protein K450DRAFT_245345 [Umbelopsis ramanniana AG]